MVGSLIQIRTKIGSRTFSTRKLFQQLGENIPHDVIRHNGVMTQPKRVFIDGRRVLIEDRRQSLFVKFLSRFEERDSICHQDLLPSSCSIYRTLINSKK